MITSVSTILLLSLIIKITAAPDSGVDWNSWQEFDLISQLVFDIVNAALRQFLIDIAAPTCT